MDIRAQKKAIYTVVTADYDLLFPPTLEQVGWDLICFTDNPDLRSDYYDVRPLPDLPEFKNIEDDPVKKARLIKILPHRFLPEYDYCFYLDANRVIDGDLDAYVERFGGPILCFESISADAYSAIQALLEFKGDTDPLQIAPRPPVLVSEKEKLTQQLERFEKGGLKTDSGCPGTALLGRQHNHKTVIKVMESWAKEVLRGSNYDEVAFPYACHQNKFRWTDGLSQRAQHDEVISDAESLAVCAPHKSLLLAGRKLEEIFYPKNPPPPGGKYDGYPFLLTVGVPVSNQIKTIRRCLEHMKPLLDAIDSELVVVDTGSTDGTVEVCLEYGARVVNFPWINNMSAARNQAIQAAKGCWYMSIDDDEWFEDIKPIISFFTSGDYKNHNMAMYFQRNYPRFSSDDYFDYPALRLAKTVPSLHFEGRIHDVLCFDPNVEGPLDVMQIQAYAKHYGFASEDPVEQIPKTIRNLSILKLDLIQFPTDIRHGYQTIRELRISERFIDAYRIAFFSMSQFLNGDKRDTRMFMAIVAYMHYVISVVHGWKQLLAFSKRYLDFQKYVEYDRCMMLYALARANFNLNHYDVALRQIYDYYKTRSEFYALPQPVRERQASLASIDRMTEDSLHDMMRLHMAIDIRTNRRDDLRELICSDNLLDEFHDNYGYRDQVISLLLDEKDWISIAVMFESLRERDDDVSLDFIFAKVDQSAVLDDFLHIRDAFSSFIDDYEGFKSLLLLREADPSDDNEAIYAAVLEYVKGIRLEAGSLFRLSLLGETFRLGIDPERALGIMEIESIDYLIAQLTALDERTLFLYRELTEWQQDIDQSSSAQARYLAMKISVLLFSKVNKSAEDTYLSSFERLIDRNYEWNEQLYISEMLEGYGSPLLPPAVQSVCAAHEAIQFYREENYVEMLRALRKTLEKESGFRNIVKAFRNRVEKKVSRETKQQTALDNEFTMLLGGVKLKIEQLIATGQQQLAVPLIAQLEQLAPNDPDIKKLKHKAGQLFS